MVVSSSGLLVNLYCFVADYIKIISIKGRRLRKSEKERKEKKNVCGVIP